MFSGSVGGADGGAVGGRGGFFFEDFLLAAAAVPVPTVSHHTARPATATNSKTVKWNAEVSFVVVSIDI